MSYKKYPASRQLSAELDSGTLQKAYLLLGEEEGEKEKAITRIIGLYMSESDADGYSAGRYHIDMGEFMQAAEFAMSQSMFSDKKVCVMLNVDSLPQPQQNSAVLNDVLRSLPDAMLLIMTAQGNAVPKFLNDEALRGVGVYQFWRMFEKDIVSYIIRQLGGSGISADERAVWLIVEMLGRDMRKIDDALEKIRNYGAVTALTAESVRELLRDERDTSVYEFVDALFKREKKSLSLLRKLVENNFPELLILNHIIRQAEAIERYYAYIGKGRQEDDVLQNIGVPARGREDFRTYTVRNPAAKIRDLFPLLHETDSRLKSYRFSKEFQANPLFELVEGMLRIPGAIPRTGGTDSRPSL